MNNKFINSMLIAFVALFFVSCIRPDSADSIKTKNWIFSQCSYIGGDKKLAHSFVNEIRNGNIKITQLDEELFSDAVLQYFEHMAEEYYHFENYKNTKEWVNTHLQMLKIMANVYVSDKWKDNIYIEHYSSTSINDYYTFVPSSLAFDKMAEMSCNGKHLTATDIADFSSEYLTRGCNHCKRYWNEEDVQKWSVKYDEWTIPLTDFLSYIQLYKNYDKVIDAFKNMSIALSDYADRFVDENVKIINWAYDENAIGDAYTGYFIEYEIGTGYYILYHLVEMDNKNSYEGKILYQGNSMIEMQSYYE